MRASANTIWDAKTATMPEGMQVFFYRNLENAFVPDALVDSEGPAPQPERFSSLIEAMQKQPRAGDYEIPGATAPEAEKLMALPLTGQSNELLAAILVGSPQAPLARTSTYIRNAALAIGAAGIFLVLIFSWSISRQVSVPLERLAKAARELGAGRWNVKADTRARGEAGRAVRAFNEMSAQIAARREKLVQAERVSAWRELARNFAVELKLPLFSLQVTLENLSRAREQTPEQFDEAVETAKAEHVSATKDYLLGTALLGDYLAEGLEKMGISVSAAEGDVLGWEEGEIPPET